MATLVWTVFAVAVIIGIFATCVIIVAAGTRYLEDALTKRRDRRLARTGDRNQAHPAATWTSATSDPMFRRLMGYLIAVATTGVAWLVRAVIDPFLPRSVPFST